MGLDSLHIFPVVEILVPWDQVKRARKSKKGRIKIRNGRSFFLKKKVRRKGKSEKGKDRSSY